MTLDPQFQDLELSTQILIQGAKERGLGVKVLDRGRNYIELLDKGRVVPVVQATRTNLDPYLGVHLMTHKPLTNLTLHQAGIPVPQGVGTQDFEEAWSWAEAHPSSGLVVKPASTNFGEGITILPNPPDRNEIKKAWEYAKRYDEEILVEEYVKGEEVRVLIIGGKVRAALRREPANVIGDGQANIRQLIEEKNKDPLRGTKYRKPLEKIKADTVVLHYLEEQGLSLESVPLKGEKVFLRKNSNISTGGDSIDVSDNLPPWAHRICQASAAALDISITGIDLIWNQDLPASEQEASARIIEMNFNPALHIHNYPYQGKNRQVEQYLLDALGF